MTDRNRILQDEVSELKEQLDTFLGGEEMIEQLTERNLDLGEKVTVLETTVQDLETLRDLNEELEESHLETEKQLQFDLGSHLFFSIECHPEYVFFNTLI